jgi:hypothetical protein
MTRSDLSGVLLLSSFNFPALEAKDRLQVPAFSAFSMLLRFNLDSRLAASSKFFGMNGFLGNPACGTLVLPFPTRAEKEYIKS